MGEYWPVFFNGRKIHSHLLDTLYDDIYREKMGEHWDKRGRMTRERSMLVNWDACAGAMQILKIARRHWVAKHTEGMCGVGKWLVICEERDTGDCPRCSAPDEDARHVWLCPSPDATKVRQDGIDRVD